MSTREERKRLRQKPIIDPMATLLEIIQKSIATDGYCDIHVDDIKNRGVDITILCDKVNTLEYDYGYIWKDCQHHKQCDNDCAYQSNRCTCITQEMADSCQCSEHFCDHKHHYGECDEGQWLHIDDGPQSD